jgi:hypothetical protein
MDDFSKAIRDLELRLLDREVRRSPGELSGYLAEDFIEIGSLVTHPAVAAEYGELKRRRAAQFSEDIDAYVNGKVSFIKTHEMITMD